MNEIDCTLVELVATDGTLKSLRGRVSIYLENLKKRIKDISSDGILDLLDISI